MPVASTAERRDGWHRQRASTRPRQPAAGSPSATSPRRRAAATTLPSDALAAGFLPRGMPADRHRVCLPQWLDQHVVSALGPSSYAAAGAGPDLYARPQSVPPGTMLAGRLATWPDTSGQRGDGDSLTAALAALQGRPSFEGFAAQSLAQPPAPSWETRAFGGAAAEEDPIKQVSAFSSFGD